MVSVSNASSNTAEQQRLTARPGRMLVWALVVLSFVLGGGVGFDASLGYYHMISRPDGAPSGQVKLGLTLLF